MRRNSERGTSDDFVGSFKGVGVGNEHGLGTVIWIRAVACCTD